MMTYLSIDTEFSSFFSPNRHKSGELLQLAIRPVVNGIKQEPFNEYCRPLTSVWNKHAEKVHGISRKKAETFQHPAQMAQKLKEFLEQYDKVFFALGHNHTGDKNYLKRFVSDYDLILEWNTRVKIHWKDTVSIAKQLKNRIPVKDVKLETLANYFKIEINAHDALSDADVTSELYQMMEAIESAKQGAQSRIDGLTEIQKRKKYIDMKYISISDGCVFLSEHATSDREALRICLEEIWTVFGEL
jgi:DNA polymerase III epsilon subunit-like protein